MALAETRLIQLIMNTKVTKDKSGKPVLHAENEAPEAAGGDEFALSFSESKDKPTSSVRFRGVVWGIREMREDEREAHRHYLKEGLAEHLGIKIEAMDDKTELTGLLKTIPNGTEKVLQWRAQGNENICLNHIKTWTRDVPCTAAEIRDLVPSVKTAVARLILEKSLSGSSSDDFLEPS